MLKFSIELMNWWNPWIEIFFTLPRGSGLVCPSLVITLQLTILMKFTTVNAPQFKSFHCICQNNDQTRLVAPIQHKIYFFLILILIFFLKIYKRSEEHTSELQS